VQRAALQESGHSLVEALVGAAVLAASILTLSQLLVAGARDTASARDVTIAGVLAAQKLEELASVAWGFDEIGVPTGSPPLAGLEYLDRWGRVVGSSRSVANGTAYVRRWRVDPVDSHPGLMLVFHVRVAPASRGTPEDERRPGEASLIGAKTRKVR
jgi:hypothetical protein